ncbi:protein kinase [Planctomycetota bacterium]
MAEGSMLRCSCGEPLESDWEECPVCYKPIEKERLTCPQCGRDVKARWKKCPNPKCKTPLDGWATPTHMPETGKTDDNSSQPSSEADDGPYLSVEEGEGDDLGYGVEVIINEGDVLDKYTIQGTLGSGGFGSVYLAYDTVLKEKVALKVVVAGESGKAQNAREQIIHEFKLREKLTDLSHIVSARDPRTCLHKNVTLVLLPMDLAGGGSFRDWLKKNKSEEARTKDGLKIFRQACLGVKAIHDAGLSHLDIKPENILLVDGAAKIADFGIGRYGASMFADNPKQVNRQGIGTPQYMSPEQFHAARQKDIGQASDIYSLGVVLYELVDGSLPFDGSSRDEYRQKHLHDNPTEIKGACAKYWGIISRCMGKKADDRYFDIDQLISDLDRAAQGASLRVDVSCPQCNHINSDAAYEICEQCGVNLPESLFRECHRCMKRLRLDTEICPGCGFHVMAYYVLQERWQKVQILQDEDPVEAMELLEMILRDDAAEHEEQALALVKDLRKKQLQIRDLIADADKAMTEGEPEEALEAWQGVLEVIPRHRLAGERNAELKTLLAEFTGQQSKALTLMNQANFKEADGLLQKCLELIPARQTMKDYLDECRKQAIKYATTFEQALSAYRDKLLTTAIQHVGAALTVAPKSLEALDLKSKLDRTIAQTKDLLEHANRQLTCAKFDDVERSILKIEELQSDMGYFDDFKTSLLKTRKIYEQAMVDAEHAKNELDLNQAVKRVENALQACPDSAKAHTLLKAVKADQEKAHCLLNEAISAIPAAQFDEVDRKLQQIDGLWPYVNNLNQAKEDMGYFDDFKTSLLKTREIYEQAMADAERAKNELDLDQAVKRVENALQFPERPLHLVCCFGQQ